MPQRICPGCPLQNQPEQTSPDADEQRWVARAQAGDLVAFNAIVERHQTLAYNVALRMLRDPASAEDVAQEAFFSAYRNISHYRGGSLRSWLLAIVANGARDALRSRARRRTSSLDEYTEGGDPAGPWADPGAQPDESAERAETVRVVRDAVARLPDDQRLVVTLVDLQGLDYQEASQVTGANIGTVKSRLFRARQRLRELLRGEVELSSDIGRQYGEAE